MAVRFCPDCGDECRKQDVQCLECGFPLTLRLESEGRRLVISGAEARHWRRVAQLLMKNGMVIETEPSRQLSNHQAWWIFPGIGLIVFLSTLVFGDYLVSSIWPPPPAPVQHLDLGAVDSGTTQEAAGIEDDNTDVSFLVDALKTSEAQTTPLENDVQLSDYVDRVEVEYDVIKDFAENAHLDLNVDGRPAAAIYLSAEGYVLAPTAALVDAFTRRLDTVQKDGSLVQGYVVTLPRLNFVDGDAVDGQLVQESDRVALSLLRAPLKNSVSFAIDFEREPGVGDEVWLGIARARRLLPERARIDDVYQDEHETKYLVLGSSLGETFAGSPVFSIWGDLTGILLHEDGRDIVLTMRQVRERAPFVYSVAL